MDLNRLPIELRLEIWEWTVVHEEPAIYVFNRIIDSDNKRPGPRNYIWRWGDHWPASDDVDLTNGGGIDGDDDDDDEGDEAGDGGDGDGGIGQAGSSNTQGAAARRRRRKAVARHYPTKARSVLIPFPVAMRVCAESRAAATRALSFRAVQHPVRGRTLLDVPCRPYRPELDAVFVPAWEHEELPPSFARGNSFDPGFYRNIRTLVLQPDFVVRGWHHEIASALPALETIAVVPQALSHRDVSRCLRLQLGEVPKWRGEPGQAPPDVTLIFSNLLAGKRRLGKTGPKPTFDEFVWRSEMAAVTRID